MLRIWLMCLLLMPYGAAQAQGKTVWRAATAAELEALLPARAPVEKERIETEMRTATGIRDGRGHTIAAVVLITAGYAADGKYSHYMVVQSAMTLGGEVHLKPGTYVVGWKRTDEGLLVHFYQAGNGVEEGAVVAHAAKQAGRVEQFRIWPPGEKAQIQIGRFLVGYSLEP